MLQALLLVFIGVSLNPSFPGICHRLVTISQGLSHPLSHAFGDDRKVRTSDAFQCGNIVHQVLWRKVCIIKSGLNVGMPHPHHDTPKVDPGDDLP